MKSSKLMTVIVAIIIIAVVAGGGYYAYHYETTGTMKVSAADNLPSMSGLMAVDITFSAISLHSDKASSNTTGWTNYSLHDKTVNILNLNASNAAFLSNISVHAGSYNLMKIYIKNVTVHINTQAIFGGIWGSNTTVNLTPANASAFVVPVHPATVSAHSTTHIVLDFNLAKDLSPSSSKFSMGATVDILS